MKLENQRIHIECREKARQAEMAGFWENQTKKRILLCEFYLTPELQTDYSITGCEGSSESLTQQNFTFLLLHG